MDKVVLVVDDEQSILSLLDDFLSTEGYRVITCLTAEEGLAVLASQTIPVVISDLSMPKMDGVSFCKEIRETNPITVVIALTGFHKLFEVASCRDAGFDDYLKKPVDLKLLLEVVDGAYAKVCRWLQR